MSGTHRTRALDDLMDFDHVIQVHSDGSITDRRINGIYAPDLIMGCDSDGQVSAAHEADYIEDARSQGWELETGWTGQHGYHGLTMHPSEYIGGALEAHIRETPGLWVAIVVTCYDGENAGWAVARRDAEPES